MDALRQVDFTPQRAIGWTNNTNSFWSVFIHLLFSRQSHPKKEAFYFLPFFATLSQKAFLIIHSFSIFPEKATRAVHVYT
jgi:hypothetical protein